MAAIIVRVDDIHYREEDERKVPADETLVLALDGREYELDLTAEHAQELRDFLRRYMTAGELRKSVPSSRKSKATWLSGTPLQQARHFRKTMRAFADSRPDLGERSYKTPKGNFSYTPRLEEEYAKYVAEHGEFPVPSHSDAGES